MPPWPMPGTWEGAWDTLTKPAPGGCTAETEAAEAACTVAKAMIIVAIRAIQSVRMEVKIFTKFNYTLARQDRQIRAL